MAEIVRGRYRHFKGGVYIVTGTATHSETGEELVIYHKDGSGLVVTDEEKRLWARPTKMWNETVFRHGSEKPRFELLNTIPAAEVVEVRHGRWINERQEGLGSFSAECDQCGKRTLAYCHYNFCPNCGAKMDGGQNE